MRLMRILVKDPMKDVPLIGIPILRVPEVGIVVRRALNPGLSEKLIDPDPDSWNEKLGEGEVIIRVPMDQWKREQLVSEYVEEFTKREGIVGVLSSSIITK